MKFFLFSIIILTLKNILSKNNNLIKFPFKLYLKSPENLTNYFFNNSYISSIYIGTPKQKINIQFLFDTFSLIFPGHSFNGEYNEKISNSYENLTNNSTEFDYPIKYPFGLKSKENFYINENEINLNFLLIDNIVNNTKLDFKCGGIGLGIKTFFNQNDPNFIQQLIEKNYIESFCFTVKFINENEGFIYIGKLPHEYEKNKNKFNIEFYKTVSGNGESFFKFWGIFCKYVYYENYLNKDEENEGMFTKEVLFNPKLKGVEGTYEFKEFIDKKFFNKLFENGQCEIKKFFNELRQIYYLCYICDLSINLNLYKSLYFYEHILNYTFILDKNDLFKKYKNKYIYQIFFRDEYNGLWTFGDIFFQKYQITFDQDKKIIGFYINENKQFNYLYIVIIILIIMLIFLFYYLIKIYFQFKIKPKNIINEYYDYKPNSLNKIFFEIS